MKIAFAWVLILALLLPAAIAIAETESDYGMWQKKYYLDEFNLPTDDFYICNKGTIKGTFSNSATNNSDLSVVLYYSRHGDVSIRLIEYGSQIVKNTSRDPEYYDLVIMGADGKKETFYKAGEMMAQIGSEVYLQGDANKKAVECLRMGGTVRFRLTRSDRPSTYYIFSIENANGFDKVLDSLYSGVYEAALAFYYSGNYEEAISLFRGLNGYKDSAAKITACETAIKDRDYAAAVALYNAGKYEDAKKAFQALNGYKDSNTQIKECDYAAALVLFNAKKYEEAKKVFAELNGYKDSAAKMIDVTKQQIKDAKAGSIVSFGSYEQDNNKSNGSEVIEWIILDKQGTKALLISRYVLDSQLYNKKAENVTWETCTLRTWLNGTFLNAAFSAAEQKQIVLSKIQNPNNNEYGTKGGNVTTDSVFLLSIDEAKKYFASNTSRSCLGTAYANAQGVSRDNSSGVCQWWLRSPGAGPSVAAYVNIKNDIHTGGWYINTGEFGIRPAIWIDVG